MEMNYHFFCHIIRDIFPKRNNILLYGNLEDLQSNMLRSEHSMGSYVLHSNHENKTYENNNFYWNIEDDTPYIDYGQADLFISIDYSPNICSDKYDFVGNQVKLLLKSGGIALLIDTGEWSSSIGKYLKQNNNLIKEINRYSMMRDRSVYVYENI